MCVTTVATKPTQGLPSSDTPGKDDRQAAYLPGVGVNDDQEGRSPRVRLCHCTSAWLTPTIIPNVDNSNAQFLLVGTAFAPSLHHPSQRVLQTYEKQEEDVQCEKLYGGRCDQVN